MNRELGVQILILLNSYQNYKKRLLVLIISIRYVLSSNEYHLEEEGKDQIRHIFLKCLMLQIQTTLFHSLLL